MYIYVGFPGDASGKEPACRCRRLEFDSWDGKIPGRRAWQSTPVFLPGNSYGQRSLEGYSLWGCKESDMAEAIYHVCTHICIYIYFFLFKNSL